MKHNKTAVLALSIIVYALLVAMTFTVLFFAEEGLQHEENRIAAATVVSQIFIGIFGVIFLALIRNNDWKEDWRSIERPMLIKKVF